MKRKIIVTIIVVILIFVIGAFLSVFHAAKTIAQYENAQSEVSSLVILFGNDYRGAHGQYPSTLAEVVSAMDSPFRERAEQILHDKWHDDYQYQPLATGFSIIVRGFRFEYQPQPDGFLIAGRFSTNTVTIR